MSKIAIVHPSLAVKGGAENVVVWLAEELSRRGHAVDIITTDYDEKFYGNRKTKPFQVIEVKLGGYEIRPLRWVLSGWRLRHLLTTYDYINSHNFPAYIWVYFARIFNKEIKAPHVWFCEEPMRRFYRDVIDEHVLAVLTTDLPRGGGGLFERIQRRVADLGWRFPLRVYQRLRESLNHTIARRLDQSVVPQIDLIISNSKFIATVVKRVFGLEAVPCLLGVPLERFGKMNKRVRYEDFTLAVSRLMYEKNLFNLVRALKLLVEKRAFGARQHIIAGGGPLFNQLRDFIREQNLEKIVILKGFVSEKELSDLYRRTKLVVYLTLDETYGLPFPEAGLYKKAVIGPNHGGPSELVVHGKTGYQVDPLDPADIARYIEKALASLAQLKRMGENNFRRVTKELDFSGFVDRFMKILDSTFENRH